MAEVIPFRGTLYNPKIIKNIADVVTPPYDVISDPERDAFYERHPNSVVRLDKGKPTPTDTHLDNPHTRAAAYFQNWLKDGILVEDSTSEDERGSGLSNALKKLIKRLKASHILVLIDQFLYKNWPVKDDDA